jgi:hypothetical protein
MSSRNRAALWYCAALLVLGCSLAVGILRP